MQLESDRMVNLIVNKAFLDKEREVVKNERRFRTENSPEGTMYETIYDMAFTHHPYHWPVIGYEKDLDNAQPQQCLDFYKNHYAPNNATVVIVGDVNPGHAVGLIEKYYGALIPQPVRRYSGKDEPEQKGGRSKILHLSIPVEKVFAGYRVPGPRHADGSALELLANLVGHTQSSRLYRRLVDGGLASAVDVSVDNGKGGGLFLITAFLQKGRRAQDALQTIKRKCGKSIERTSPRRSCAPPSINIALSSSPVLSQFRQSPHHGHMEIEYGSVAKAVEDINAMSKITVADVNRVARRYLRTSQRSTVVVFRGAGQ